MVPDEEKMIESAGSSDNKRKWENNQGGNFMQPPNKWQKVAKAYTVRPGNKTGYAWKLPMYNKCTLHHAGPCTVQCRNCKKVGHLARNYRVIAAAATQRPIVAG
ncbi:hypothetical protein Tco_0239705, partial [Tanacetum coccineum]